MRVDESGEPFREGRTVRTPNVAAETPTAQLGQENHKSRLVAPLYDTFTSSKYSLAVGAITHLSANLDLG